MPFLDSSGGTLAALGGLSARLHDAAAACVKPPTDVANCIRERDVCCGGCRARTFGLSQVQCWKLSGADAGGGVFRLDIMIPLTIAVIKGDLRTAVSVRLSLTRFRLQSLQ